MTDDLQTLVDDLAAHLRRSVVIDDPGVLLLCASRHFGDEDPVRVRSVLQRTADRDVIAHVLAQSPGRWPGAGTLVGSAELGLAPRLCVPVRERGLLLGFLMVIDADATLTPEEIDAAERCARAAAARMSADRAAEDRERAGADAALRDLLGGTSAVREAARERLVRDGLLRDAPCAVVTVVEVTSAADTALEVEMACRTALRGARAVVDRDRATVLRLRSRPATPGELRAEAVELRSAVAPLLDPAAAVVVGTGGAAPGLASAWVSRREAGLAVRAARRSASLDGVGVWDELGELGVLVQLPDDLVAPGAVTGPLRALAAHDGGARLRETLRSYLDHAGSVPRTAAALHLHRTSLYYRLGQIRDVTGLDLDDGGVRLLLHLALRLDDLRFPTER